MLDTLRTVFQSLRFRLVLASSAVLIVVLLAIGGNCARLLERILLTQEDRYLARLQGLFSATLAEPLARRDGAKLTALAEDLRRGSGLAYLVLQDETGLVRASSGWDGAEDLPPSHSGFEDLPAGVRRFDGVSPVRAGSLTIGRVYFGIPIDYVYAARRDLLLQSILIGWLAFIVSVILLTVIGHRLTRDLRRLQRAVAALRRGESPVRLAPAGNGEIAQLMRAFNEMSASLDERVEALQKSEARFHAIADYTFGAEAWFDPEGRLIWVNPSIERLTGYTPQECLQAEHLINLLVHTKDRRRLLEQVPSALKGGEGQNFEIRLMRKGGGAIWVALNWQAIYGADGGYQGLRVSVDEIQARKEAELRLLDTVAQLRRAQGLSSTYLQRSNDEQARLVALLNVLHSGALFVDVWRRVIYCNKAYRRIWGFAEEENLTGVQLEVLIERSAGLRLDNASFLQHLAEVEASSETSAPFEIALADGRVISEMSNLVPAGRVWTYEDVTEAKAAAEQLIQLATRDPLTNLFNRRRFLEEIERMLPEAARHDGQIGLLSIDLDGFKPINDEFGHQAGDQVLITLAREVSAIIRRNEMFFRLGGDEFAVLASDTAEADMIGLARRVGERIEAMRFVFSGREVQVTASLGIAMCPTHALSAEQLIARADLAMYRAKSGGKNRWRVYQRAGES